MSNYTKTTNFAAKDSLPSGNAGKIVKGTEIDAEFNNIATASATKADINDATLTGTTTFGSLNDGTITITGWVDEDNMSSNSAVLVPTQQSVKAYVDTNVTAQDLDVTDGSTSIDIDLDSESLGILGGTGVTSTASGTGVTLAIDSTVATLTGTQTLTNKTLTTPTILTSFTIGSATISEAELEILDGATVTTAELNVLDGITSTTAELNILDGVTSTAAEINILDGVTSTTAELNKLDGFTGTVADLNYAKDLNATGVTASEFDILDGLTSTTVELNILDGVTSTTAELNILDGVTATTAELNILDGVTSTAAELNILDGVTSTTAELNILDGVTSTATELNLLDGVTATTAELNYTDGVTSSIQTQLDSKISGVDAALTGNATITTADDTVQLALISTSADANAGPILDLFRNSVSAADNDLTGQVYFSGKNDADEKTYYGQITSQITDVSNGSEDFALELSTLTAGAPNSRLFISPTETVFNESSADLDFRIESDGNTNAFFLEGSSGNVSLSNNLAVTGAATVGGLTSSGNLTFNAVAINTISSNGFLYYNVPLGYTHTFQSNSTNALSINGQDISFYNSAGTSQSLFWDASAESLGIGTSSPSAALEVTGVIKSASATQSSLYLSNAARTNGFLIGRSLSSNDAQDLFIYDTVAASTRLIIDSSGSVGIGTSSFNATYAPSLQVTSAASDGTGGVLIQNYLPTLTLEDISGGAAASQIQQDQTNMLFKNNGATRMTINASGNVGVGVTPSAWQVNNRAIQLLEGYGSISSNNSQGCCDVSSNTYNAGSAATSGWKYKNTGASSLYQQQAGQHKWFTAASGSADATISWAEAMRIDSSGSINLGVTTPTHQVDSLVIYQPDNYALYSGSDGTGGSNHIVFGNANSWVGSITTNGSATQYLTSSDQRLKENIADADDAGSKVDSIQVRKFDWKVDGSHQDYGMIAQELKAVAPEAVTGDADSEEIMGVDYSKLVPMMLKEIQSLRARVNALEAE